MNMQQWWCYFSSLCVTLFVGMPVCHAALSIAGNLLAATVVNVALKTSMQKRIHAYCDEKRCDLLRDVVMPFTQDGHNDEDVMRDFDYTQQQDYEALRRMIREKSIQHRYGLFTIMNRREENNFLYDHFDPVVVEAVRKGMNMDEMQEAVDVVETGRNGGLMLSELLCSLFTVRASWSIIPCLPTAMPWFNGSSWENLIAMSALSAGEMTLEQGLALKSGSSYFANTLRYFGSVGLRVGSWWTLRHKISYLQGFGLFGKCANLWVDYRTGWPVRSDRPIADYFQPIQKAVNRCHSYKPMYAMQSWISSIMPRGGYSRAVVRPA